MRLSRAQAASFTLAALLLGAGLVTTAQAQQKDMSFFVTSAGKGDGANLGGLEGADAHCDALAKAAGSTKTNWRAYLSTTAPERRGRRQRPRPHRQGPVEERQGRGRREERRRPALARRTTSTKETALTEKGEPVTGRGDPVNMHDILTGSDPHGMYSTAGGDTTCGNWTKQRRRLGHRRPPRPHRPQGHAAHEVVELLARHPRLRPGGAQGHRRRRPASTASLAN